MRRAPRRRPPNAPGAPCPTRGPDASTPDKGGGRAGIRSAPVSSKAASAEVESSTCRSPARCEGGESNIKFDFSASLKRTFVRTNCADDCVLVVTKWLATWTLIHRQLHYMTGFAAYW